MIAATHHHSYFLDKLVKAGADLNLQNKVTLPTVLYTPSHTHTHTHTHTHIYVHALMHTCVSFGLM